MPANSQFSHSHVGFASLCHFRYCHSLLPCTNPFLCHSPSPDHPRTYLKTFSHFPHQPCRIYASPFPFIPCQIVFLCFYLPSSNYPLLPSSLLDFGSQILPLFWISLPVFLCLPGFDFCLSPTMSKHGLLLHVIGI